jgi:hypothetical protein
MVDEVDRGMRSPLVNLQPYLKEGPKEENDFGMVASKLSSSSFLAKFLLLTTVVMAVAAPTMIMNEAKLAKEERPRLWIRKLAYCSSSLFPKMKSMPECGNMPDVWEVNEDNVVSDLSKFKKSTHKRDDPEVTMDCPPWWRACVDGHGGKQSLGRKLRGCSWCLHFRVCLDGIHRCEALCFTRAISSGFGAVPGKSGGRAF